MYMYESVYARSVILQAAPDGSIHFYCVQDFHDAGVSQGPELAERIASKRQPRPGCANVKGEDAALGAIFLAYAGQPVGASGRGKRAEGPYALCAVVKRPDGVVNVHAVAKTVSEHGPFGDGRRNSRLEEVHGALSRDTRAFVTRVSRPGSVGGK
jgi:hypothetical protein